MIMEMYEGVVTVLPIIRKQRKGIVAEIGTLGEPIMVRTEEMYVRASSFFDLKIRAKKDDKPRIAFIYEDAQRRVKLKVRQLSYMDGLKADDGYAELSTAEKGQEEEPEEELELGASHIIPVPLPTGR